MNTRGLAIFSLVVMAALVAFAFVTAARLPEGAMLPTHWNAAGEVDQTRPALEALLIPPAILLFVTLLFVLIPRIEPLQERLKGSAPVLRATWLGLTLLIVLIAATIGMPAYGFAPPVKLIFVGVGALLLLLGNVMPKSRPGFFVGARTPWAIMDTDNWIATNRLAGKLMMLAGAAIIVAGLVPINAETTAIVLIGSVVIASIVPVIYSWWLWEQKKRRTAGEGE